MEILALAALAGATAVARWLSDRRRSGRLNRDGCCAGCGAPWQDLATADVFLLHGRLVCAACAEREKARMAKHFGVLALAMSVATTGIVAAGGLGALVLPLGATAAMALGTVTLMKRANLRAQRRIASGDFPDYDALLPPGP